MNQDRMNRQGQAAAARRPRHLALATFAVMAFALAAALPATGDDTGPEADPARAATEQEPVTGKLSKPGYTVIALAAGGEAVTDVAGPDGRFSLTPPAGTSTLHLRAPGGTYAGPITLTESEAAIAERQNEVAQAKRRVKRAKKQVKKAKKQVKKAKKQVKKAKNSGGKQAQEKAKKRLRTAKKKLSRATKRVKRQTKKLRVLRQLLREAQERQAGSLAIVGTKAGAKLGSVSVFPDAGYAKAVASTVAQWGARADANYEARAKAGVPIGAGNFGLVYSKNTSGGAPGDLDGDGVANQLDVDVDGDGLLDDTERSFGGGQASDVGAVFPDGSHIDVRTNLSEYDKAANANGGSSNERIAEAQARWGGFGVYWIGIDPDSGELDCGGLTYCSPGGTGKLKDPSINDPEPSAHPPFPDCCDLDDDGFGSLVTADAPTCEGGCSMNLFHGATVDEIGTGDVPVLRSTVDGVETQSATTLGFAFSTPPVYAGYDDGQGNSTDFSYETEPCAASPCTVPVSSRTDGDVIVDLSVWRPQRSRLETDPGQGEWIDIGKLTYLLQLGRLRDDSFDYGGCPQDSLSESDPYLASPTPAAPLWPGNDDHYEGWGGFLDTSADQPQDPANKFTFTVNLSQCMASRGLNLEPGDVAGVGIQAWAVGSISDYATAESGVAFEVQP